MLNFRSLPVRVLQKQRLQTCANTTVAQSSVQESKWDVLCGLCLERKPIILREMTCIEKKFAKILSEIERENSQKSEHEIQREEDIRRAALMKSGKITGEDVDKAIGQTAVEFEDSSRKEAENFIPASPITEADQRNDVRSTDRKLNKHLTFIVNEKVGFEKVWMLPHAHVKEGETLRQAAERLLREKCGSNLKAKFYGNAPYGFYKYKYPTRIRQTKEAVGAKIFFMKAQYTRGTVHEKDTLQYNWATRTELDEKFPHLYNKAIKSFLIEDEEPEKSSFDTYP